MRMKKLGKIIVTSICTFSLLCTQTGTDRNRASAAEFQTTPTDVTTAAAGNVLIGVDGTFLSADLQAGVQRINEIRKEAYDEGIISAYVPVRLSAELIGIANIRAAEAALKNSHTRPNGKDCFTATYQGMKSYGEILAWNFSGLVDGINQWYSEKRDLVEHTGGVTGHYTQMIDPNNVYIGLSCFKTSSGVQYPCSICGEFNAYESHTDVTDQKQPSYNVTQLIEVPESKVSIPTQPDVTGKPGEKQPFGLSVKYNNRVSAKLFDLSFTSSSKEVAEVLDNQLVCKAPGKTTLSATYKNYMYQVNVTVSENGATASPSASPTATPTEKPTVTPSPKPTVIPSAAPENSSAPVQITTPSATNSPGFSPSPHFFEDDEDEYDDYDDEDEDDEDIIYEVRQCKKIYASKKQYVIKRKGKSIKTIFSFKTKANTVIAADAITVTTSKKKIIKVVKKKLADNVLKITVKGLKKGKTTLTVKVGKKRASTKIKVKA